ncbi:TnsA-like heteromeric transposase endonuclease subunit [Streptomyces antibioticus]|uniref:TnsA-like heteromeric transposase endonuclease subunit n=1 Tax=Streptomyces antibioticus TaxID=1890 RepID=UPI001FD87205|nr:TnsA-like heteromeric transposase endonuclease subunit [Streptomyces antibioticus]
MQAGWSYRRLEPLETTLAANLKWLVGYRHPRNAGRPPLAAAVREAFTQPRPLIEGTEAAGDPIEVLPAVFHALWHGHLTTPLDIPLHERVLVSTGSRRCERPQRPGQRERAVSGRRGGRPVLQVGAHVRFRDSTWQVIAVAGQQVHLAGETGGDETVVAGHLFADPSFTIVGAETPQAVTQWGLFETAPEGARRKALAWQRHIREVESGLPGGPDSGGVPRPEYDPDRFTLAQREGGQGRGADRDRLLTCLPDHGAAHAPGPPQTGLVGLVDHRTTRRPSPTGRTDERVITAIEGGAAPPARPLQGHRQGPDAPGHPDPLRPAWARHGDHALPGHLLPARPPARRSRRTPPPPRPDAPLPGRQAGVHSDRGAAAGRAGAGRHHAAGRSGRLRRRHHRPKPELTIAVDVATRAILAAVLRPAVHQGRRRRPAARRDGRPPPRPPHLARRTAPRPHPTPPS